MAGTSANAYKIDSDKYEYGEFNIAQGVSGTILLGSFGGAGANKGISQEELKLCVMKLKIENSHQRFWPGLKFQSLDGTGHQDGNEWQLKINTHFFNWLPFVLMD